MKVLFIFISSLLTVPGISQLFYRPAASAGRSMGAFSKQEADIYSCTINMASLARLKSPSAAIYTERRFMMAELNYHSAVAGISTSHGNIAIEAVFDGFVNYSETQAGIGFARALGSRVDLGVQVNYCTVKIPSYGSAAAIGFELGILVHHSDKLHSGISVANLVGGKLDKQTGEKLPSQYTIGIGYEASAKVLTSIEIVKQEGEPLTAIGAIRYKFMHAVWARAGVSSHTSSGWLAVGIAWKTIELEIMSSFHPYLGISPGLLIVFTGKNKKSE